MISNPSRTTSGNARSAGPAFALATMACLFASAPVQAEDRSFRAVLLGTHEVPAVSTVGYGGFALRLSPDGTALHYHLAYNRLEGSATQAHIHVGQKSVNGGVAVWLCSNLASPPTPAGVQPCPAPPASISGTITAADVVGPAGQGVGAGEFGELVRAIRNGVA